MKSIRALLFLLVPLLALPLFAQTPTDPVAWLKSEGNATDATTNGNNGVVTGTVPYVTGRVGNAFNFTGNVANYVRIPNSASLQSSLLTVEYWVNFNSALNAVNVAKRNGSSDAWQAGIVYSGGNFLLQFVGNTSGGLFDWYSAPLSSPVGVWTHVAVTYDGSTVKGYINGTQVLTQSVALQLSSRNADIFVGNYAGTSLPLDAKLDELSIYNRALSAAEVLAIFQAGSTGKTSPPTVTSLSPNSGSTAGGTNVTITGTNFTGATSVAFGGDAATNVTVVNATTLTATTPAGTAGAASVIVATAGGTNSANSLYTYVTPPPTVTSISPSSGTTLGGTSVTLTGTNFIGATSVTFGGSAATNVSVVNATTITATTPAGSAGTASVIVTTPAGTNSANSLYTYVAPPAGPVAWLSADGHADDITGNGNHGVVNGSVPYVAGKVGQAFSFTGNGANSVRIPNSASLQSADITVEYWIYLNSAQNSINVTKRSASGAGDAWQVGLLYSGGNHLLQFIGYVTNVGMVDWYSPPLSSPVGTWTHVAVTYTNSTIRGFVNGVMVLEQVPISLQLQLRGADIFVGASPSGTAGLDGKIDELTFYNRALSGSEIQTIYNAGSTGKTPPAPTVTSISPASGSTLGGTSVTITGTNLNGATGVTMGGNAATIVSVVNRSTITATTPAGTAGSASVVVTTPGGTNLANTLYTYVAPPTVASVSPNNGSGAGGTSVTLTGTNFTGATSVTFGGNAATNVTVVNATTITATVPARSAGTASVVVTTIGGSNAANSLFTYSPTVTASTANLASNAPSLTINGAGFSTTPGNNTVAFTPAGTGTVTAATATSLTVTSLSGLTTGALNAVVTTNGQSSGTAVQVATVVIASSPPSGANKSINLAAGATYTFQTSDWGFSDAGDTPPNNFSAVKLTTLPGTGSLTVDGSAATAGQSVSMVLLGPAGATWTVQSGAGARDWRAITSSADGTKLAAVVGYFGQIYTTTDSGVTWTERESSRQWRSITSSADGTKLAAVDEGFSGGKIYTSTNSGATWTARASDQLWKSIASSSDGTKLVAAAFSSQIYTSTDSGVTWTARESVRNWRAVTSSADGTKLAAIAASGSSSQIYTSTDSGATWTPRSTYTLLWAITSSADGTKLATVANGGRIYTSTDSGATWTARESDRAWNSITSSADGTKLAAVELDGQIYLSTDSGATWSARESNRVWRSVTSSSDGTKLAAAAGVADQGVIATSAPSTPAIRYTAPNAGATTSFTFQVQDDAAGNNLDLSANTITLNVAPPPPTITGISPVKGVTLGGTTITLTGTDFTGATSVTFGGAAATNVTVVNSTTITATTPATSSAGAVSVIVTTPSGSNAANSLFTYELPGIVVNASSANLISSGTRLIITGTGFDGVTPGNNVVTFSPSGTGTVTASSDSSLTVTGISGLTVGALNAVVTINSASSGTPVQVANVVAPIPGDLIPQNFALTGSYLWAIAVQPDGKTILAGNFSSVGGVARNYLARLNSDGTLDTGFDPKPNGIVNAVAVQPDGKIVIGGSFDQLQPNDAPTPVTRSALARLNADGTLDPSVNTYVFGGVNAVSVQADGKILFGGQFSALVVDSTNTPRGNVARLNADGSFDATFNPNVKDGLVYSIVPQADGKILLGGTFSNLQPNGAASPTTRWGIARVNADGSLDAGFDPRINDFGYVTSMIEQPDGKIVIGGNFGSLQPNGAANETIRSRLARVNADGTLDTAFNPEVSSSSVVWTLALQANGKIIAGGDFSSIRDTPTGTTVSRANVARLNADGSLDVNFDPKANSSVYALALRSDGEILLGGGLTTLQPNGAASAVPVARFARLINDPATQALSVIDTTQVRWNRGGGGPELSRVTFEVSIDAGSTWVSLGAGSRVGTTSDWQLTGLSLPASGQLRARGIAGASALETTTAFSGQVVQAPTVASVSPANGSTFGGTSVTISGNGFIGVTAITFGGTAAASFTVVNANTLSAITPAHAAGSVRVDVTAASGTNAANSFFTFVTPPAPTVTGVSPSIGVNTGGTSVTITGTEFLGATSVTFGGTAATNFTVVNSTTITATAPAHATGAVSVVVTTPSGSNAANTLYTFVNPPPTITSVSPSSGVNLGGTVVTITGADFNGATSVRFGTREAASFTVVNSTTITATTPLTGENVVSVTVTTPTGSNAANSLFTFRAPIPTNTQLSSSQFTSAFLSPPTFIVSVSTLGGAPVPGKIALFIDDVLLERKAVDASGWAYFTPTPAQLRGGTRVIRAVYNDDLSAPDYYSSEAGAIAQTVTKSPLSISLDSVTLTQTYDGTPRPVTATVGTLPSTHTESGVQVNITYNGSAIAPTNAGTYTVVASINDPSLSGSASGTLTISPVVGSYTFENLVFTWDGQPKPAVVTVTPNVPVTVTYDRLVNNVPSGAPTATPPVNPGNYRVIVTKPNYDLTPSTTNPLTITARGVSIAIGNLRVVPDGTPKPVTITTTPAGINVDVTYQRPNDNPYPNPAQPFAGTSLDVYVEAKVNQVGYEGKATAFQLFRPKGAVTLALTGPATGQSGPQTYQVTMTGRVDNRDRTGTITLLKGSETVGSIQMADTYDGRATLTSAVLEPGTHAISARYEGNDFYESATSNVVTTTIAKLPLTLIATSPLTVTYDGRGKSVSFRGPGTPPIPVEFDVTYDNSTTLPVNVTTTPVQVRATIKSTDPRYTGTTTVPLTITKAPATLALGSLTQSYDGTPKSVSVITSPAGVATSVTYNGSNSPPTATGSYNVAANVVDPNYTAQPAIGTFTITSGTVRIAISNTLQTFVIGKDSYPITVTTTPPVAYSVTYNGVSYDVPSEKRGPYGAGTYDAVVTITQPGYTGTASATLVVKPLVTVNHPEVTRYGSNYNNLGSSANGASAVDGTFVSPGTPFPLVEGAKLRFFDGFGDVVRYRFVRWKDGNLNQERLIEANTRVYTPVVRPEIKIAPETYTKINGVEQKSTVGGTVVPLTNGRTYANEREVVTFVAYPNPGYVVDRWEHHDFSAHPRPTVYSLKSFSHLYGTEFEERGEGFAPVKVYFTKGYTATSGVNVREAGSVELVRQDGYGYDETHHVVGRVDARFPNAVIPEGINTVAKAVPAEGYLFNTWILEGAVPADLSNPSLWNPEYNAALIRPTLTVKPFPGVTSIKLTAVFVRKVAAPVASFTRNNELSFGVGNVNVSFTRNPILKIANEGTAPLVNARITGVEISGARLKVQSNEAEELNTGGFYDFYLPPTFRPLTPEEVAAPDPWLLQYNGYGVTMIANKPRLTAPSNPITESNPITIGTLNPGQDREFNDLQYAWVKTDLSLGNEFNGVSFSFLQYRVTVWIKADNFPATPVSFWTN
jgi:uncharacterized delta-60 repeat protein